MTKFAQSLLAAAIVAAAAISIASPASATSTVVKRPVVDSAGQTVNRLPGRSMGLPPQRAILVCGGSGFGHNVCRSVKSLPLRYYP